MEVKAIQICYKQVKVNKKHLYAENHKEFYYNIKVFVDYSSSTVHLKKTKTLHLQRNICNKYQEHTFFNWDSLHARLTSLYKAWDYKKKKHKKMKGYMKSPQKESTDNRCLLTLDLKSFRSQVKGKHFIGREFQSLAVQGKKLLTQTSL